MEHFLQIVEWHRFRDVHGRHVRAKGGSVNRQGTPLQRLLFEDGAQWFDAEQCAPPPEDPRERAKLRREFLQILLKQEETEFHAFKKDTLDQAAMHKRFGPLSCPAPLPDAVAQLQAGKERIEKLREELAAVEESLRDPEEERRCEERARIRAEREAAFTKYVEDVKAVEI